MWYAPTYIFYIIHTCIVVFIIYSYLGHLKEDTCSRAEFRRTVVDDVLLVIMRERATFFREKLLAFHDYIVSDYFLMLRCVGCLKTLIYCSV